MSDRIRWGVIGSGGIARRRTIPEGIMPAENAELVAVYNPIAETNEAVAREFHACAVASVEELLATAIDAVYIASPPAAHRAQAIACALAGKHVLCEKPLGLSVADAEAMIATCRSAGVRLGTAFMMRFQAQHQAALEIIQRGGLGKPVFGRAQLSCWYPPLPGAWRQDPSRAGGGSLMDMGGHCIDLLEMFFGPVRAVSCLTNRTVHDYATEDSAVASLVFANGALGVVDTFFCLTDEASENRLELYGSLGGILARGTIGQGSEGEMIARLSATPPGYVAQQARTSDGGLAIKPASVNTYRAEIEEFGRAIQENREPTNDAQRGLHSQKVLAACYESAGSGQVVEIQ